MPIHIPVDVEPLIAAKMQRGGYSSTDQVIRDARRALVERNSDFAAIAEGIDDMDAGRIVPRIKAESELRDKLYFPKKASW